MQASPVETEFAFNSGSSILESVMHSTKSLISNSGPCKLQNTDQTVVV